MAVIENQQWIDAMGHFLSQDEKAYLKALGARIAQRRKELDLTQQQVADALRLKQQAYGHYEVGRHRMPISLLPALAEVLSMDVEVLLGMGSKHSKRGPAPKFLRQIDQISRLPKSRQRILTEVLDGLLVKYG